MPDHCKFLNANFYFGENTDKNVAHFIIRRSLFPCKSSGPSCDILVQVTLELITTACFGILSHRVGTNKARELTSRFPAVPGMLRAK